VFDDLLDAVVVFADAEHGGAPGGLGDALDAGLLEAVEDGFADRVPEAAALDGGESIADEVAESLQRFREFVEARALFFDGLQQPFEFVETIGGNFRHRLEGFLFAFPRVPRDLVGGDEYELPGVRHGGSEAVNPGVIIGANAAIDQQSSAMKSEGADAGSFASAENAREFWSGNIEAGQSRPAGANGEVELRARSETGVKRDEGIELDADRQLRVGPVVLAAFDDAEKAVADEIGGKVDAVFGQFIKQIGGVAKFVVIAVDTFGEQIEARLVDHQAEALEQLSAGAMIGEETAMQAGSGGNRDARNVWTGHLIIPGRICLVSGLLCFGVNEMNQQVKRGSTFRIRSFLNKHFKAVEFVKNDVPLENVQSRRQNRRFDHGVGSAVEAEEGTQVVRLNDFSREDHALSRFVAIPNPELISLTGFGEDEAFDCLGVLPVHGGRVETAGDGLSQRQHAIGDVEDAFRMFDQIPVGSRVGERAEDQFLNAALSIECGDRPHGGEVDAGVVAQRCHETFQDVGHGDEPSVREGGEWTGRLRSWECQWYPARHRRPDIRAGRLTAVHRDCSTMIPQQGPPMQVNSTPRLSLLLTAVVAVLAVTASPILAEEKLNTPPKGFKALFNGKDLTNWQGLVGNPKTRAQMSKEELAEAQKKADEEMREHWKAVDGILVFDGKGKNLCTKKKYANFELYVDWKIEPKGDSGIYLRGTPQVQIWDPTVEVERNGVGSGGLFNNKIHPSTPTKCADNPIGEWNTFWIKMVDDKVSVKLNGELVVDNVVLENYWERDKPIYPEEAIELQNHGNTLYFRNIYVKELP